jgi:hypothetical protein
MVLKTKLWCYRQNYGEDKIMVFSTKIRVEDKIMVYQKLILVSSSRETPTWGNGVLIVWLIG